MLLCNCKVQFIQFLPQHAACQCLLSIFVFTFAFASVLELVCGDTLQYRQAGLGRHLAHWLVCRSRAHQGASTVLHCTGRCTREETKEGAPGIHLGPDNSLRFGLLPAASSHLAWTFGFFWVSVETSRELWSNFWAP